MSAVDQKTVDMHRNFFDKTQFAIDNGFFIEAISLEYAAIESRLESICGQLELPCGQKCPNRKDIKISQRIECLRKNRILNTVVFETTKLPKRFFTERGELRTWIKQRDIIIHALYKNSLLYQTRTGDLEECAQSGICYARALYNEAKRIQRMRKNHSDVFDTYVKVCSNPNCKGNTEGQ